VVAGEHPKLRASRSICSACPVTAAEGGPPFACWEPPTSFDALWTAVESGAAAGAATAEAATAEAASEIAGAAEVLTREAAAGQAAESEVEGGGGVVSSTDPMAETCLWRYSRSAESFW